MSATSSAVSDIPKSASRPDPLTVEIKGLFLDAKKITDRLWANHVVIPSSDPMRGPDRLEIVGRRRLAQDEGEAVTCRVRVGGSSRTQDSTKEPGTKVTFYNNRLDLID